MIELDATHLVCPLPVLKAERALHRMQTGEMLCLRATDKHSPIDVAAFCLRSGHQLIKQEKHPASSSEEQAWSFYIKCK